jgi:hypothetical protein
MADNVQSLAEHQISSELCERLRLAVVRAADRDAASMAALRVAVREFAIALRGEGTTPEAVLIILKRVITDRTLNLIAPHASDWRGDQLRERINMWCIEEYFSETTA